MATPNLAGFRDAQARLIDKLGADVTFVIPQAVTWPSNAQLDPETHVPYDPTVTPSASGSASATVKATIIEGNLLVRRGDDVESTPLGRTNTVPLILKIKASDRSAVEGATLVRIYDRVFNVTEIRPKGLDQPDSYHVYCESA